MKKILTPFVFLSLTLLINAQTVKVYSNGAVLFESSIADSVVFVASDTTVTSPWIDETLTPEQVQALYETIYKDLILSITSGPGIGYNESSPSLCRSILKIEDISSDLLTWIWQDIDESLLILHSWSSVSPFVEYIYNRLYRNIIHCNSYLDATASNTENDITTKRAEVRFLRAYYYYWVMNWYGRGPIVTSAQQGESQVATQSTRAQLYSFVISELTSALNDLPTRMQKASAYKVDKAAAWLLLSRVYLNAEVFTGIPDWHHASYYANLVITQGQYSLSNNYAYMFMRDNDLNGAQNEFILPAYVNGLEQGDYGPTTMVASFYGSQYSPSPACGVDGWTCSRSQRRLIDLFFNPVPTYPIGVASDVALLAGDSRALFCNSFGTEIWRITEPSVQWTHDFHYGWLVQKWTNVSSTGDAIGSSTTFTDTDVPVFRLAEAYLNYAEAQLRSGNSATALTAVNTIRSRAGASPLSSITLQDILDERGREFYAEGHRRTDLIRFGMYGGNNNYFWEGKQTNFDLKYNVFPIPQSILTQFPSYMQNTGY